MMNRRYLTYALVTLLSFSLLANKTTALATVLSISENSISENTTDNIEIESALYESDDVSNSPYEHGHDKGYIQQYRDEHKNDVITRIKYENNGTWGYDQTWARNSLYPALNSARMDSSNWWFLDDNNVPYTNVTITKGYVYDTELEAFAMQRAAELVISYNHYRPTGQQPQEILEEQGSVYQWCRNYNELIGFGPMNSITTERTPIKFGNSATDIVYAFMEEYNKKSGGQAHRRAILMDKYYRIGIGVVKLKDGHRFVAIELAEDSTASDTPAGEYTNEDRSEFIIPVHSPSDKPAVDGYQETYVSIATNDTISTFTRLGTLVPTEISGTSKELMPGQTYNLNTTWFCQSQASTASFSLCKGNDSSIFSRGWSSNDTTVATVQNGIITAKAPGKTDVVCYDEKNNIIGSVSICVPEKELKKISVTCNKTSVPAGTVINASDITVTRSYSYGNDDTVPFTNYSVGPQFTISEGTHTYNVIVDGMVGSFTVTGTKTSSGEGNTNTDNGQVTPTNPTPQQPTQTVYTQKITVAKKFQKTYLIKYSTIKKSSKTYKLGTKVTASGGVGHGIVVYKVTKYPSKAKKYISVNDMGKVTFKKGAKKGTYKIQITAKAVSGKFKKATKTVTIKIK